MNLIIDYLDTFVPWLLLTSLKATSVAALIILVQFIFHKKLSARWLYMLWFLLIVKLLLPLEISSPVSIFNVMNKGESQSSSPMSFRYLENEMVETAPISNQDFSPQVADLSRDIIEPQTQLPFTWFSLLGVLWIIGASVFMIHAFVVNIKIFYKLKKGKPVVDRKINTLFKRCKEKMGVNNIELATLQNIKTPFLFGIISPRILFSEDLLHSLSSDEQEHIFLHELAHHKRGDISVALLATILQILHWFNPVIWFAFYKMRLSRELACDELVLSKIKINQSREYGNTLISLLKQSSKGYHMPLTVGIIDNTNGLKGRLEMIARFKKKSHWSVFVAIVLLVFVGVISLTGASTEKKVKKIKLEVGSGAVLKLNEENIHIDSLSTKLKEFEFEDGSVISVIAGKNLTLMTWGKVHAILRSISVEKIEHIHGKTNRSITTLNYKDITSLYEWSDLNILKPTEMDGKWGYTDKTGNFVIEPRFDKAQYFQSGIAIVQLGNKFGCINQDGKMTIKPEYSQIHNLHDGFVSFQKNDKLGVYNKSGEIIVEPKYGNIFSFTDGYALVRRDNKYGFINQAGELVIPLKYEKASLFWEGLAAVQINNKWGYINKKGEVEIQTQFVEAGTFQSGRAKVKVKDKYGFINHQGVSVIPPQFDKVENFSEGLAAVSLNEKYGFIDIDGKVVIKPQYDFVVHGFQDGFAQMINFENPDLGKKGNSFSIDKTGNLLQLVKSK